LLKRQTFQPPIQRSEDNVVSPIDNVLLYSVFFSIYSRVRRQLPMSVFQTCHFWFTCHTIHL